MLKKHTPSNFFTQIVDIIKQNLFFGHASKLYVVEYHRKKLLNHNLRNIWSLSTINRKGSRHGWARRMTPQIMQGIINYTVFMVA